MASSLGDPATGIGSKQIDLVGALDLSQVLIGQHRRLTPARGALDVAFLNKVGFIDLLDGAGILAHSGGCC